MAGKNVLDKLIVDEDEDPNYDILASLIEKNLKFTKEGEFIYEKEFNKSQSWKKIMIYLLGRKVVFIKELKKDFKEQVTPKDISDEIGIPQKSVCKFLSTELKGITKSQNGSHFIPNYNLHKCEDLLNRSNGKT